MERTKRNWAFIFSPVIIASMIIAVLFVYMFIITDHYEMYAVTMGLLILLIPWLFGAWLMDILLKAFLKNIKRKVLLIWIIEVLPLCSLVAWFLCYTSW